MAGRLFFCFPNNISGAPHFRCDFCVCDRCCCCCCWVFCFFFNPTIEVVAFRLRGWCMLDVFLLPAFMCLGRECQYLLGWNACAHRLDLGLYSHPKEFRGSGVRTRVNSKGNIPCIGGVEEVRTGDAAPCRTMSPTHCLLSYSAPPPPPPPLLFPRRPHHQASRGLSLVAQVSCQSPVFCLHVSQESCQCPV